MHFHLKISHQSVTNSFNLYRNVTKMTLEWHQKMSHFWPNFHKKISNRLMKNWLNLHKNDTKMTRKMTRKIEQFLTKIPWKISNQLIKNELTWHKNDTTIQTLKLTKKLCKFRAEICIADELATVLSAAARLKRKADNGQRLWVNSLFVSGRVIS